MLDFTGVGNCKEDQCSCHVLYTDGDDAQAVEIKRLEIRTTRNRRVERDKKDDQIQESKMPDLLSQMTRLIITERRIPKKAKPAVRAQAPLTLQGAEERQCGGGFLQRIRKAADVPPSARVCRLGDRRVWTAFCHIGRGASAAVGECR